MNYVVPEPRRLGLNGSFAVFKKVETDVVGFEDFLQSNKDKIDPELLAAKMCGRWRNGVPLALSPETDSPAEAISPEQLNDFQYVDATARAIRRGSAVRSARTSAASILEANRSRARGCPVAATTPTGSSVAGMPYGPAYDPTKPYDGIERGMLFQFISSNIENQYEFVLRQWVNDSEFAGAVRLHPKSKDPLIGTPGPSREHLRHTAGQRRPADRGQGLSSFVTTKAAAYTFLPSITALKFIADPLATESKGEP